MNFDIASNFEIRYSDFHVLLMRALLINPWIYDFAAFNLWSRPLGLLKVAEYLSQFDITFHLIDCTETYKTRAYNTGYYPRIHVDKPQVLEGIPRHYSRYGISVDEFVSRIKQYLPFDVVFVTSNMTYWYPGVRKVVETVRDISTDSTIILGGIYATLYPEHAKDIIKPAYMHSGTVKDDLPIFSEMKKVRKSQPFYTLSLYKNLPFAPILTSTGCPFSCTYCASRFLNGRFNQRPVDEVFNEITELNTRGVKNFAFYDDALLANADHHVKPLLKKIVDRGLHVGFHCPNGLHARYMDDELAYLMKEAGFKAIRLGLETIDEERQMKTGGKIRSDEFKRAVDHLKKHGFTKKEIGTYLMYGLPSQTLNEVKEGVRFLQSLDVRINLTEYSPIPKTGSFNQLVSKGIIPEDIDPLLTNNTVFSYLFSGYERTDVERLKLDVKSYNSI